MEKVVVVGASLAGLHALEALRRHGYRGQLVLVGEEPDLPYDRPPLTKDFLCRSQSAEEIDLRPSSVYRELDVSLQLGRSAVDLDVGNRKVLLEDGQNVTYDGLVIATGATPRRLPGTDQLPGVYTLRTRADSMALRDELSRRPKVVVIGGGFIGAETASTSKALGCEVDLVEALPLPMSRALGDRVGAECAQLLHSHGVRLHCGQMVARLTGKDRVRGVELGDGTHLAADLVVVGIGVTPCTEWLEGSKLTIEDGVVCDERCIAGPGIVAAGDVARWYNPLFQEHMRVEHWDNAVQQGEAAAVALLRGGSAAPFAPVPYVWSDQLGVRIQVVGRPRPTDEVHLLDGAVETLRFVYGYFRSGVFVGAVAFNRRKLIHRCRELIAARGTLDAVLALKAFQR
jgi:NADPH-dependent 2,4-dienoyl-CoA reductase/sulfur reductase-like enzyme